MPIRRSARLQAIANNRRSARLQNMANTRGYARLKANAQQNSPPSSSESSSHTIKQFCIASSSSSKRYKETEISEVEKSGNESISPLNIAPLKAIRKSDQNSLSNTSDELHSTIRCLNEAVSPPAQADSPAGPSGYVECHNTRLARTSFETNSASEGTFNTENFNSKLGAQNQGREESDQGALPSVIAKKPEEVEYANISEVEKSGNELTATLNNRSRLRESHQNPLSNTSAEIHSTARHFSEAVSPPVQVDSPPATSRPTHSTGLTEFANMFHENVNQDEVQSFLVDPALVTVEEYRVKEKYAPILRNVMEKHGDIAVNCIMETGQCRSLFLEEICEIVQTLKTTKFVDITETKVKEMLTLVGDLGRANMDVQWLHNRLEEILEATDMIKQFSCFKESMERNAQTIEKSKSALRSYEDSILACESQLQELKEKANLEKKKMVAAQAENRDFRERVSTLKPKVERFINESLFHDLE